MIPIVTVLPIPSPPGVPVHFAHMEFREGPDGSLEHYLEGNLWASVPPEGWDHYAKAWPACAELVAQLKRGREAGAGASSSIIAPSTVPELTPAELEAVAHLLATGWRAPPL